MLCGHFDQRWRGGLSCLPDLARGSTGQQHLVSWSTEILDERFLQEEVSREDVNCRTEDESAGDWKPLLICYHLGWGVRVSKMAQSG